MHRLPVSEIMRTTVVTIGPDELVADAAQLMEEFDIRRLPVVDEDDCLIGIVTDTDVLEAETAGSVLSSYEPSVENEWLAVSDIMTPDVISIPPDATVGTLATILMEHKIGGVPVVDAASAPTKCKRLIGIVTEMDIFRLIADAWKKETEGI
ncbi:MAG: CBS domain-containing protein [Caldilineaceae bacterium]|nr:CBS domain-containing protein [Caldilineaceae bacterium]